MNTRTTAILALTTLTPVSLAGNTNDWIGGVVDWTNPANWSNGAIPTMAEIAIIAYNGHANLEFQDLELPPMLLGATLDGNTGYGSFAQFGGTTQIGGIGIVLLGRDEGSNGFFSVGNDAQMTGGRYLQIGLQGHGVANIVSGSVVEFDFVQITAPRHSGFGYIGSGYLEVAGANSTIRTNLQNPDSFAVGMSVGASGSAIVEVRDGGLIDTQNALLLSSTAQGSSLTVDGPESRCRVEGRFFDTG